MEDLPKGAGDPDFYGYPGQPKYDVIVLINDQEVPF